MFEVGKKGATHFLCRVAGLYRRLSKLKDKNKEQGETEGRQDINDKLDTTRKSGRGTEANRAAAEDKMANQTTIIIDDVSIEGDHWHHRQSRDARGADRLGSNPRIASHSSQPITPTT